MIYYLLLIIPALLAIVFVQFVWLYFHARRQENLRASLASYRFYIAEKINSILNSPSENSLRYEISQLKEYIGNSKNNYDIFSELFFEKIMLEENQTEEQQIILVRMLESIDPMRFYANLLKKGSSYEKAHACRIIADFGADRYLKDIEKYLHAKNPVLSYNAAMALSKLGDEEGVSKFLIDCKDNFRLSRRLVVQMLSEYNEDIKSLARIIFLDCDDYTKANVIKSIAKYNFEDFQDVYLQSLKSKNATLRVAAVSALGNFANIKFEMPLVRAANDKIWIVRNAAVKALGKLDSPKALEMVTRATSDIEWWVRYNAAKTLINMTDGMEGVDKILNKNDAYAQDAVKYALYRDFTLEGA